MHVYHEGSAEDLPLPGLFLFDSGRSRLYLFFFYPFYEER